MAGETVDVFFVALKKLVVLFGGLPEWTFVYAFMAGLPAWGKQQLRVSTSNNWAITWVHLGHHQRWSRTGVVMAVQTAQSGPTNYPRLDPYIRVNCFHCGQIGHIPKDCTEKRCECVRCFQYGKIEHIASNCLGKQASRQDVSAALLPRQDVNKAQPNIQVHVNQTPYSALIDSGCSHTIVSARRCCT